MQRVHLPDGAKCGDREDNGIVLPPATWGGRVPKIPVVKPLEASVLLLTPTVSLHAQCLTLRLVMFPHRLNMLKYFAAS